MNLLDLTKKKPEVPAIAEIVLSKSTFSSSTPAPLKQRISWLKYEIPSSLGLEHVLPTLALFAVPQLLLPSILMRDVPLGEALTHPSLWLSIVGITLIGWSLITVLVLAVSVLYLVNPRELLNLFVYPDVLRIRDDLLELKWSKNQRVARLRIPWHWISQVRVREYLNMGAIPLKVLEIELSEIPANRNEWKVLKKVSRDGSFFFDPATNKPAKKFPLSGIRLPLPLFAFSSDLDLLIDFIRRKCGEEAVDSGVLAEHDDSAQLESFTALWLDELSAGATRGLQRCLPSGACLQGDAYKITEAVGKGGLSVVYKAVEKDGTAVAIKEILCNFGGTKRSVEKNVKQILNEVFILRRLDHPNIVEFKAFFAEGAKLYIVMELVEGTNARDFVQSNPALSESDLLNIASQCCSILEYLHGQPEPLLHRDFTPDNLMLCEGKVKLIDFNIAQAAVVNSSHTVMGKHCFMAPEQFCGQSTISSDLYQLGTTLYFLATGCDPEPLSACNVELLRPDLSNNFVALVRRLTEREPRNRYPTAKEVLDALSVQRHKDSEECLEAL